MTQRVVITGLGVSSPLGEGAAENWKKLVAGVLPAPTQVSFDGKAGAQILAGRATEEALRDAGVWDGHILQNVDAERMGCTVSASKPLFCGESPEVEPPEMVGGCLASSFGLRGERRNVIAACATGVYSMALGASWIEQGLCDVVLAGSVEPTAPALTKAGFRQMGVLSDEGVTRPFDQQRSGFTMGAGAGILVLESAEHALHRGQRIYARLAGWGLGADGHSPVAFNSNGQQIANVIANSLRRAHLRSEHIQHVNAHGTATRLNDWIETQALMKFFGSHASSLMISATKSSTGHLLGAAGSVEAVFSVLALHHQFIPPTVALENPDPECALDYTPKHGHAARFDHALSLSFGFGGPIGALVMGMP